jgi:membrane associated rhomboid family serine protease
VNLTRALVLVNVVVFLADMTLQTFFKNYAITNAGVMYGPAVASGQWWRLFSNGFLHANFLHIAFNMVALWQVGQLCEALFGLPRYALLYTLALLGSSYAEFTYAYSDYTLGASGAIFGLFGALAAAGLRLGPRGRVLIQQTLPVIVINIIFTFSITGISIAGHLGGLISGFVVGYVLFSSRTLPTPLAQAVAEPVPVHVVAQHRDDGTQPEIIEGELLDPEPHR